MTSPSDTTREAVRAFVDRFPPGPDASPEDRLRSRIMEVTLEIAAAEGVKGASLRRIAARTRMRTASLYSFFPGGKDELVSTALAENLAGFYRVAASALEVDDDPWENLRRLVFAHTRWTLENPRTAPAILVLERAHAMLPIMTGDAERSIRELHETYGALLADLLRAAGASAADVHRQAALLIVVGDNADLWKGSGTVHEAEEFAWLTVRRLLGLTATSRPEQRVRPRARQRKAASPVSA